MSTSNLQPSAAATVLTAAATAGAAEAGGLNEWLAQVKSADDNVRGPAWQKAAEFGAPAIGPLAEILAEAQFEIARAAKRAMWKIVRHAGRPKADKARKSAADELVSLLKHASVPVRREALWMLSEVGGPATVSPIATLLADKATREDARAALERIPGKASITALRNALEQAPEDYKPALAQSLRVRGERVKGYPSQKLVPTRPTAIKPA